MVLLSPPISPNGRAAGCIMPLNDERRRLYNRLYMRVKHAKSPDERAAMLVDLRRNFAEHRRLTPEERRKRKREGVAKWRARNRDKNAATVRARRDGERRAVLMHYSHGTMACICCGEMTYEFLSLDHLDDAGRLERRRRRWGTSGAELYRRLLKLGLPRGFQVLCFNCNIGKGTGLFCPHGLCI